MAYIARFDLEVLLSRATVLALYDDGTGAVDERALSEILELASARLDGTIARNYRGALPVAQRPVPPLIRMGALLWARAMSYERHPEYVRLFGDAPREEAEDFGEKLAEAKVFLLGLEGGAGPVNVGGLTLAEGPRMLTSGVGGENNGGDF